MTPETWPECVGLALRSWRRDLGFSQDEAAAWVDVTQSTWSRWETGENLPDLWQLYTGGVDLSQLLQTARIRARAAGLEPPKVRKTNP